MPPLHIYIYFSINEMRFTAFYYKNVAFCHLVTAITEAAAEFEMFATRKDGLAKHRAVPRWRKSDFML